MGPATTTWRRETRTGEERRERNEGYLAASSSGAYTPSAGRQAAPVVRRDLRFHYQVFPKFLPIIHLLQHRVSDDAVLETFDTGNIQQLTCNSLHPSPRRELSKEAASRSCHINCSFSNNPPRAPRLAPSWHCFHLSSSVPRSSSIPHNQLRSSQSESTKQRALAQAVRESRPHLYPKMEACSSCSLKWSRSRWQQLGLGLTVGLWVSHTTPAPSSSRQVRDFSKTFTFPVAASEHRVERHTR
ncbi:hypothetical protein BXZ70DRAFT_370980 [Cristinia sonorae]|uniref:Uncharacterized protein n=1 Tax=Cristinia sonorae TaxID=1940300 RepID=A0A8K0UJ10_9AGAR|nr:hypothetical protein BXZ70DRAFT_370980 [Cristinia sonorae]